MKGNGLDPKKRKILLVQPPFYRLFKNAYSLDRNPIGLGYLSGTIFKKADWQVMAYNADFFPRSEVFEVSWASGPGFDNYLNSLSDPSKPIWKEVESTISDFEPDVVGISSVSPNFASSCMVARIAKRINKEIIAIVGGPHPTLVGPDVLKIPEIDVGIQGEAEITIVELLNAISAKKQFDGIKGIIYRQNGQIIVNPPREPIKDLDSLCFPHEYAPALLKDYEQYPLAAFGKIFATRGCPFNCLFCGSRYVWGRNTRFRSPDNVIEEISLLQKRGLSDFLFEDDNFGGANKKYIGDLCNALIAHRPKVRWSCELSVKLVEEETIALMKKAGCWSISIGVESGNNDLLKQIRKNITIEEAFSAADIIKRHGIKLNAFFMIGFPQETEETLNDTETAMKKINCDALVYSIFTPYPGTDAFEFCMKNNLVSNDFDCSLYNHQSPANCFCINLSPQQFRARASRIEKMVDEKNYHHRIRQTFTLNTFSRDTFSRMRELGAKETIRRAAERLQGKR